MIPLSKIVTSFGIFDEALLKFIVFSSSPWINNAELKEKFRNDLKRSYVLWLFISRESTNIISFFFILSDKAHFKASIFSFLLSENE